MSDVEKAVTVLLVEDEPLVAKALGRQLRAYAFEVIVASTEDTIISSVQEFRPDVVLMDIGLGGDFDGITMAEEILVCEDTPVVLITGGMDDRLRRRAARCGAYGLLGKPCASDSIISTLQMAINKHAELKLRALQSRRLTSAFDAIDTAIVVLHEGEVELMNRAATELTGTRLAEAKVRRPEWVLAASGSAEKDEASGKPTLRARRFAMPAEDEVVILERTSEK